MPDQLRPDFLGCYGASFAGTPNIDRLASQGKLFERAVSPSPICIPARASLLTGHNAFSTGVLTNDFWLRPDHDDCGMPTLASLLSGEGYHTEAIGKIPIGILLKTSGIFTFRMTMQNTSLSMGSENVRGRKSRDMKPT